jgi:hypothetical protein
MTAHPSELYREVPSAWEDPSTRVLVEVVVSTAAAELGIPRPQIRYFLPGLHDQATYAFTFADQVTRQVGRLAGRISLGGGRIWIRSGLPQWESAVTAVHECYHAHARLHERLFEDADEEAAAERYAQRFMERFTYGRS